MTPRRALSLLALGLTLAGCALQTPVSAPNLPPMNRFSPAPYGTLTRSNSTIARDFTDLHFQLETGTALTHLTRFEIPITLRTRGATPLLETELSDLLTRLRREAGLTITRVPADSPAAITIETVPQRALLREAPNTACLVAPNVTDWQSFKRARADQVTWTTVDTRRQVAIFLPADVPPQELRDCLHEELAQALGPLGDFYRLTDSVFNDDNIHSVLTPFDMLTLRLTYAPELHSGMTRDEVTRALPALLLRLNPKGGAVRPLPPDPTPPDWTAAITTTISAAPLPQRRAAIDAALAIATTQGWHDHRAALSYFLRARLLADRDTEAATEALVTAYTLYSQSPDTALHAAHVAAYLATDALAAGDAATARTLTSRAIPTAHAAQNAALLASLQSLEAEALARQGETERAHALSLDSLGWARYGFGSGPDVIRWAEPLLAPTGAMQPKGASQ